MNNIYFDTIDHQFGQAHLDGMYHRSKLRFRWYGDTWLSENGQLELKSKLGKLGAKQTEIIRKRIDLQNSTWEEACRILSAESQLFFGILKVSQPTLVNHYWREYFVSRVNGIRLTVDTRLRIYDQVFSRSPNLSVQKPLDDVLIIEVKGERGEEEDIAEIIAELPCYANQFSKYLTGFEERA